MTCSARPSHSPSAVATPRWAPEAHWKTVSLPLCCPVSACSERTSVRPPKCARACPQF